MTVYNRTRAKAETWVEKNGGTIAETAAAAAKDADAVFTCVSADGDLEAVTLRADGCFRSMKRGALFIDHSTVSAKLARQLAVEGKDRGLLVVDAPMTGAQAGAESGKLTLMCGATAKAIEAATPIMQVYAQRIVHVGPPGAGQTTKMANQICFTGIIQSLSEAIRFAQCSGLNLDRVFEAISTGAASSWQMTNRWQTMVGEEFDFGLAVDLMRKDLGLAIEEARSNGASLPVAAMIDQFFADVQAMDGGRQDTSALIRRLPK
jgi:3-hydroxyisobutyrate dehydrogenase